MIFNERLRRLRKERGLTQAQTAEHLSIAWRNYQRLEKDGNAPSFLTFVKAAEFFGVSLDYLAGRTDAREVNRGTCPPAGPEHRIILEAEVEAPDTVEPLLRRVISAALEAEGDHSLLDALTAQAAALWESGAEGPAVALVYP